LTLGGVVAQRFDRRGPAGSAPESQQVKLARDKREANLDTQTRDARKAVEKAQANHEVDADMAAQLQRSLGNSAVAGMMKEGSDTDTSTTSAEATLDSAREETQEEEVDEELDVGELEHVLPSFSTGGGGGGGGGAPWAAARLFGGDGDPEAAAAEARRPAWRPMPLPPDPDEDIELIESEGSVPLTPQVEASLADAEARFGSLPWAPGVLSRGLRFAGRLVARPVVNEEGEADLIWSRARQCLGFLAETAPHPAARTLAEGGAALGVPTQVSLVRALARELALVEAALGPLGEGWAGVVDAAADGRARPRVEAAAAELGPARLGAAALLSRALGEVVPPLDPPEDAEAHPAALAALWRAARAAPLPVVDPVRRPAPAEPSVADAELDAIDAILAAETGAEPPPPPPVGPFFAQLEAGLTALGALQVEVAAAALAAWPWLPDGLAEGVVEQFDGRMRTAARRLFAAAQAVETAAAAGDLAAVESSSAEASGLLSRSDFLRRGALDALAAPLLAAGSPRYSGDPDPWPYRLAAGLTETLRAELVEADGFFAFPRRLALDGPVAAARGLVGGRGAAALLRAAALQAAGDDDSAAIQLAVWLGRGGAGPYTVVWAAVEGGHALSDPSILEAAAPAVREAGDGGALNLLKAAWTELVTANLPAAPDAGPEPSRPGTGNPASA
jgi:hypothetical protein